MKTLEEWAEEAVNLGATVAPREERLARFLTMLREVASDQRHQAAEFAQDWMERRRHTQHAINDAHAACMNAPEPGK